MIKFDKPLSEAERADADEANRPDPLVSDTAHPDVIEAVGCDPRELFDSKGQPIKRGAVINGGPGSGPKPGAPTATQIIGAAPKATGYGRPARGAASLPQSSAKANRAKKGKMGSPKSSSGSFVDKGKNKFAGAKKALRAAVGKH